MPQREVTAAVGDCPERRGPLESREESGEFEQNGVGIVAGRVPEQESDVSGQLVAAGVTIVMNVASARGELAGMTAVVTGAASGIGRAVALELAAAGADCLLHTRENQEGLTETALLVH